MSPEGCEAEILRLMAQMPFLDRLEMVEITGWSRGAVYGAVEKLETRGFCSSLIHAAGPVPPTRRFHLAAAGLGRVAEQEGLAPDELVRLYPVSAQWRRTLMERLDALAPIYRLACAVSGVAFPIRFRWYRALPLAAGLALPGGRTVGILRQGLTADRTGFAKRLWRLRDGPAPGTVLILMTDEVRLRHARRLLATGTVPALLALEGKAALSGADDRVWSPTTVNTALDLRYVLERAATVGELPVEDEPQRAAVPEDFTVEGPGWSVPDHLLPVLLRAAEKRALDIISDWLWITPKDLAGLMDVSPSRASQLVNPLEGFGLVARPQDVGRRLALTDRGLALLARRDRTSIGVAKKRWSIAAEDADEPYEWRNVSGRRSRQLLRNVEHTQAVHTFLAALTGQARLQGWEVEQLDPPARASRYFRHQDRMRSVNPDAFGVLRKNDTVWPFFLEWERRAVRPSTMSDRLAPYLRYFSSHRPTDDHGTRPSVLVVFEDDIAQTHFLRLAREEMQAEGISVPLWVSHRQAIAQLGPLGRAWRAPSRWESPQELPPP